MRKSNDLFGVMEDVLYMQPLRERHQGFDQYPQSVKEVMIGCAKLSAMCDRILRKK